MVHYQRVRQIVSDDDIVGTAFLEQGQWYLRYVSGEGAKVTLIADSREKEKLESGAMVSVRGCFSRDAHGQVISFNAGKIDVISRA